MHRRSVRSTERLTSGFTEIISSGDSPEAGMSRRPFQLMLLAKVKCESVTPREDFITDVAFIFGHPPDLLADIM